MCRRYEARLVEEAKRGDTNLEAYIALQDILVKTRERLADLEAERALLVTRAENAEAALVEADRNEETLLGMIRHQRDVLRECLPYINESMAGRRPGRCADDIRAAVKALTADSGDERNG